MRIEVTIGWTTSEGHFWGFEPGMDQVTRTFPLDMTGTNLAPAHWPEAIADAVFYATNAPRMSYPDGLTGTVCRAIDALDYHGEGAHYSLSVGDTVTVGEITLACDDVGWKRTTLRRNE